MSLRRRTVLILSMGGKLRSPVAAAVFQKLIIYHDLEDEWFVDFAALSPIHVGEFVDQRVNRILEKHVIPLSFISPNIRLATEADLQDSDFVLCFDELDRRLVKYIGAHWVPKVKLLGDYHRTGKCKIEDLYYEEDDPEDKDNDKKYEEMFVSILTCARSFFKRQLKPQESDPDMDDVTMPVLERYDSV